MVEPGRESGGGGGGGEDDRSVDISGGPPKDLKKNEGMLPTKLP